jgi:hypothetical protein
MISGALPFGLLSDGEPNALGNKSGTRSSERSDYLDDLR